MRGLWIAGAILIACGALADSKPPTPAKWEQSQQQKYHAAACDNQGERESQGASPAMPPAIVLNCPKVNYDGSQAPADKPNDAPPKHWWRDPNWIIAIFTTILALVGLFQLITSIYQRKTYESQLALARKEFVATHRPRLRVRQVVFYHGDASETYGRKSARIEFLIVNIGQTQATIIKSDYRVFGRVFVDREIEFKESNLIGGLRLERGQRHLVTHYLNSDEATAMRMIEDRQSAPSSDDLIRIRFAGYIQYVDESKTIMETGFIRRFNAAKGGFERERDPEHEYED